jgi:thiol:disulfide interchange protein/DsbC/DsbD-like thiol-disulfide interchange protein
MIGSYPRPDSLKVRVPWRLWIKWAKGIILALLTGLMLMAGPVAAQSLFEQGVSLGGAAAQQVTTKLVSDTTAVEAGRSFRLGVRFELMPGWHIYWRYPGEVGLPTQVQWKVPEGFEVGELQWPNPKYIPDPATGLDSYGWEGEVFLFVTVTPPDTLAEGTALAFGAESSWLACEVQCIPGSASDRLELAAGTAQASEHAELFQRHLAKAAVSLAEAPLPLSATFEPEIAAVRAGEAIDQTVRVESGAPWRLLRVSEGREATLYPDATRDLLTRTPKLAVESGEAEAGNTSLTFEWTLEAAASAQGGEVTLRPALGLYALNPETGETTDVNVYLERPVRVDAAVEVAGVAEEGDSKEAVAVPVARAEGESPVGFAFSIQTDEPRRSLAMLLFFALVGGLILNVMPCVLPVLSIKVLGFVNQAREEPKRVLRLGLVFAAGVYVSFLILAALVVGVQLAGASVGWGFQLQEPRFVIIVSGVIVAFALSLLGVFTIDLPGAAGGTLEGAARREGPGGAFFNGVLATVLATPCTAPLLGPALGFAFSQPPAMVFLFFAFIATGLALPYVLLAANPGWLRFVPKPGMWMERFKQSMSFLLFATAIWLMWVLGKQTGYEGVISALIFLLLVGIACWVLGLGFDLGAKRGRRPLALVIAVALVVAGYFFFPERQIRLFNVIAAEEASAGTMPTPGAHVGANGIVWQPFSVERVNALAAEGKTIFVDFTADWCLTCKVNERTVLSTEAVAEAFRKHGVEALLADYTRRQPEITAILQSFGRAGVPMYVIFPAGRPEEVMLLPEVLTTGLVIEKIAEAAGERRIAGTGE